MNTSSIRIHDFNQGATNDRGHKAGFCLRGLTIHYRRGLLGNSEIYGLKTISAYLTTPTCGRCGARRITTTCSTSFGGTGPGSIRSLPGMFTRPSWTRQLAAFPMSPPGYQRSLTATLPGFPWPCHYGK